MKSFAAKLLLIFTAFLTGAAALTAPTVSYGENARSLYGNYGDGYVLMSKSYFGESGINVTVQIRDDGITANGDKSRTETLLENIDTFIREIDALTDTQTVGSDVYKFNNELHAGKTQEIDYHTYEMLTIAKKMYEETGGAYDPTVYRLVDLWGFSSRIYKKQNPSFSQPYDRIWTIDNNTLSYPLPDEKYVEAFKSLCAFDEVQLSMSDGKYYLCKNQTPVTVYGENFEQWIDLGGIAKGYVADVVSGMIRNAGYSRGYVNAGTSSISLIGEFQDGKPWELELQNPVNPSKNYAKLKVKDTMLSTSGQYVRSYVTDGKEYAHIIDPKSGRPADKGMAAVTTLGGAASEGDCLTTAITVMGKDKAVEFANGKFVAENKLKITFVYFDASENTNNIVSNIPRGDFEYLDDVNLVYASKFADGKLVYSPHTKNVTGWVIAGVAVITVAAAAAVIMVIVKKHRKGTRAERNVDAVKNGKPFRLPDLIAYFAVLSLVVVLFVVFVFGGDGGEKFTGFRIIKEGENYGTVYAFEFAEYEKNSAYKGVVGDEFKDSVTIDELDGKLYVTVKGGNGEEDGFNIIEVTLIKGAYSVKVADANCSAWPDCVKAFFPITSEGHAIVCLPHSLKVVGSGGSGNSVTV